MTDPLDNTLVFNQTGLVCRTLRFHFCVTHIASQEDMMSTKSGAIWCVFYPTAFPIFLTFHDRGGYLTPYTKFVYAVTVGQKYLMENTTLGIPAMVQSEGVLSSDSPFSIPLTRKTDRFARLYEPWNHLPFAHRHGRVVRHRPRATVCERLFRRGRGTRNSSVVRAGA